MHPSLAMFPIGTTVNVTADTAYPSQDFTGIVVGHQGVQSGGHGPIINVKDQDGDCWSCTLSEVTICTDNN